MKTVRLAAAIILTVVFWILAAGLLVITSAGSSLLHSDTYTSLVRDESFQKFLAMNWSRNLYPDDGEKQIAAEAAFLGMLNEEKCREAWASAVEAVLDDLSQGGEIFFNEKNTEAVGTYLYKECGILNGKQRLYDIRPLFRIPGSTAFNMLLPGLKGSLQKRAQDAVVLLFKLNSYTEYVLIALVIVIGIILFLGRPLLTTLFYWSLPGIFIMEILFLITALLGRSSIILVQNIVSYLGAGTDGLRLYIEYAVERAFGDITVWSAVFGLFCLLIAVSGIPGSRRS